MNDEQLDSLLRQAAKSEPLTAEPPLRLAANVLDEVGQRQVRRRRLTTTLTVAGAYVAGMLTMWVGVLTDDSDDSGARPHQVASEEVQTPSHEAPDSVRDDTMLVENEEHEPVSAVVEETPLPEKTVYHLFRELGDTSHARGDVTSSVRYYRLALDAATEHELQPAEASDNLLLLSLKQDRMAVIELAKQEESL